MDISKLSINASATFIIPYYADDKHSRKYLNDTIEGMFCQTDCNWIAVIINDASPKHEKLYLDKIQNKYKNKIKVIHLDKNYGPGMCRNIGVLWAYRIQSPIILFNDSDDISHPQRLEVVKDIFNTNNKIDLIYSTVNIINENNELILNSNISPAIMEILKSHHHNPVEGYDAWIRIGTETGYTNKTSSTSVRTDIAYHCPFPLERASEDSHTWMRMSAHGAYFKYALHIPTRYRMPSYLSGQTSRSRIGNNVFNKIKVRIDSDGFNRAIDIAISKGKFKFEDIPNIKSKFYKRLSETMRAENEWELVELLQKKQKYYRTIDDIYHQLDVSCVNKI